MTRDSSGILLLIACMSLTVGAGLTAEQSQATLTFDSAATNLASVASNELSRMRDETMSMNIAMYRLPDLQNQAFQKTRRIYECHHNFG